MRVRFPPGEQRKGETMIKIEPIKPNSVEVTLEFNNILKFHQDQENRPILFRVPFDNGCNTIAMAIMLTGGTPSPVLFSLRIKGEMWRNVTLQSCTHHEDDEWGWSEITFEVVHTVGVR